MNRPAKLCGTVVEPSSTFSQAEKVNAVPRDQDPLAQVVKFKGFRQEIFPLQEPCFSFRINFSAVILWSDLQYSAFPFNQMAILIMHRARACPRVRLAVDSECVVP